MQPQTTLGASSATRPPLAASELALYGVLIDQRCGLHFGASREHSLARCLWERMRARNTASYTEYFHYLSQNSGAEAEWRELLELLVNQETAFFRHSPSFEALERQLLPRIVEAKLGRGGTPLISLWSAGCASGEEPYSLAIAALETAAASGCALQVLASDLSRRALERTRSGRYRERSLQSVSPPRLARYFSALPGGKEWEIAPELRSLVRTLHLNLADAGDCWPSEQDVIFCQNVLIYFRPEVRLAAVARLGQRLSREGFLVLAPGELIGVDVPGLELARVDGCLVYRRPRPAANVERPR